MLCATGEEQPNQSTRRFLNFVAQQESEHDISSVNSTANLSTLRHLTNHSMISEPGVNRWNGGSVKAFLQVPPPFPPSQFNVWPSSLAEFFWLFQLVFCLFPSLKSLVPGQGILNHPSLWLESFEIQHSERHFLASLRHNQWRISCII